MEKVKVGVAKIKELLSEICSDAMGGWFELPEKYDKEELAEIKKTAKRIQKKSDFLVCVGIGGSYLGHRAVIEALKPESKTKVLYAGNSLSSVELEDVLKEVGGKDWSINIISKSGTTMEPLVAFRILKEKLIEKYGEKRAYQRIYATTDAKKGVLFEEAEKNGYKRFVVPDNIGGRYSVLTAVGMLPMAVAGVDVEELLAGAAECREKQLKEDDLEGSLLIKYAVLRDYLYRKGFGTEVLATFEPRLHYFQEWWKQLIGESEGKGFRGIFPATLVYSTDLHSMGQYMQQGRRDIFETFLEFKFDEEASLKVPKESEKKEKDENTEGAEENKDTKDDEIDAKRSEECRFDDRSLVELNRIAMEATVRAHSEGENGIPVIVLNFTEEKAKYLDERTMGAMIYFFEVACALTAKMAGVNPFDQPGVETYKKEMLELLIG